MADEKRRRKQASSQERQPKAVPQSKEQTAQKQAEQR